MLNNLYQDSYGNASKYYNWDFSNYIQEKQVENMYETVFL